MYQVIRDAQAVSGGQLAGLTLHEFGHSFVNPAIGDQIPAAARPGLEKLWSAVREPMRAQAYTNLPTFLNELVLRATTIRAVLGILSDYEAHRDRWPRFQDFGPELLTRLAGQADELLASTGEPAGVSSLQEGFEGPATLRSPWPPAEAAQHLTLRGQAETSTWQLVSVGLEPRRGTVTARFQVKGQDLRREAQQFNNAWAGFLLEGKDGKKRFEVNPSQVKSLRFGMFLSISGELSFDDLSVEWEQ